MHELFYCGCTCTFPDQQINTVVTRLNAMEVLAPFINEVSPMRWKLFQVLALGGENCGSEKGAKQDVVPLLISHELYRAFVRRNEHAVTDKSVIVPEDNSTMVASYILVRLGAGGGRGGWRRRASCVMISPVGLPRCRRP